MAVGAFSYTANWGFRFVRKLLQTHWLLCAGIVPKRSQKYFGQVWRLFCTRDGLGSDLVHPAWAFNRCQTLLPRSDKSRGLGVYQHASSYSSSLNTKAELALQARPQLLATFGVRGSWRRLGGAVGDSKALHALQKQVAPNSISLINPLPGLPPHLENLLWPSLWPLGLDNFLPKPHCRSIPDAFWFSRSQWKQLLLHQS